MSTILLFGLVACGGGNRNEDRTRPAASTSEGVECTQEAAIVCPEGQIDACEKALAEPEEPPADAGTTGTMMAVEQGRMGKLARAGTHRCVAK